MSVSKLPSGRYRAQVYDERTAKVLSAAKVLGLQKPTFASKREAEDAVTDARRRLRQVEGDGNLTVREFWRRWLSEPLFLGARKPATIRALMYRTRKFVDANGELPLAAVDRKVVRAWLQDGSRNWSVLGLRTMWGDAINPGLVAEHNPWTHLGLRAGTGNRDRKPPTEEQAARMRQIAWDTQPPGYAAWLQVAQFTGMRPGELDALRWDCVDLDAGIIHVRLNLSAERFGTPKNGREREVVMLDQAREALLRTDHREGFVFLNTRGEHWNGSARYLRWKRVRKASDWEGHLYLATRHFAGHYLYELCRIAADDVAVMLGHRDGGDLVRTLYGHHDEHAAQARIRQAVAHRAVGASPIRRVA